jgi:hypothetical protein
MDSIKEIAGLKDKELKLPEICTPIVIYFFFSIIIFITTVVLTIMGKTEGSIGSQIMNYIVYLIIVILFCLFLFKLCKLGYGRTAWFFAILPFLFIFVRFILFLMVAFSPPASSI